MSDAQVEPQEEPAKRSKLPLVVGLLLAVLGAGGGFYASWSGMILAGTDKAEGVEQTPSESTPIDVAYVALDPLVISLRGESASRHLKFRAHLEVPTQAQANVETLVPRVIDVLNSYLRAIEPGDLEDPSSLARLRAQMLRRVQVVTGPDMVNDLLIMEFVLT